MKERERVLALFLLVIIEAIFEPIDLSLSLSLSLFQCLSSSFFIKKIAPRDDEALFITHTTRYSIVSSFPFRFLFFECSRGAPLSSSERQ